MKFITLTNRFNGEEILVNPEHISTIAKKSDGTVIHFIGSEENCILVKESPDMVVASIVLASGRSRHVV